MQISRARHAGACYGVKRALRLVDQAIGTSSGPVYTLGPLIHNPQAVDDLRLRGVLAVGSIDDIAQGTVVIRSHGVPPDVIAAAEAKGLTVLDATCPHVSKAQAAARELSQAGYIVVVVGERGHPEVEGISAYAGGSAMVVQAPDELQGLTFDATSSQPRPLVGVVAQTTQTTEALSSITAALTGLGIDAEVYDTICFATRQRQQAASELAQKVDVMLVVGGRNSSNTSRLTELCLADCARTYHLEKPDELDPGWFIGAKTIGITAGASTPEGQIEAVEQRLLDLFGMAGS